MILNFCTNSDVEWGKYEMRGKNVKRAMTVYQREDMGLDMVLDIGLDMGLDTGLDMGLGMGLDKGLGMGLDMGLGMGLGMGLDMGLDMGMAPRIRTYNILKPTIKISK